MVSEERPSACGPARLPERRLVAGQVYGGELSASSLAAFRVPLPDRARGKAVIDIHPTLHSKSAANLSVGVARAGCFPSFENMGYHWTSGPLPGESLGWHCVIDGPLWPFSKLEATLVLQINENPPLKSLWAPDPLANTVTFEHLHSEPDAKDAKDAKDDDAIDDLSFEVLLTFELTNKSSEPGLRAENLVFRDLYSDVDGSAISVAGCREIGREGETELTYGEVEFMPFCEMLCQLASPKEGEVFIDLGSGTGRAVIAVALAFPKLQQCIGIEVVPSLHATSQSVVSQLSGHPAATITEMREADLRNLDSSVQADIVWISSLCMPSEVLTCIKAWARCLKPGSRIITMTETFGDDLDFLEVLGQQPVVMSFGCGRVYAFQRKSHDLSVVQRLTHTIDSQ